MKRARHPPAAPGRHNPVVDYDVDDNESGGDDLNDVEDNNDFVCGGGEEDVADDDGGQLNLPDPHLGGELGPALDLDPVEPAAGIQRENTRPSGIFLFFHIFRLNSPTHETKIVA